MPPIEWPSWDQGISPTFMPARYGTSKAWSSSVCDANLTAAQALAKLGHTAVFDSWHACLASEDRFRSYPDSAGYTPFVGQDCPSIWMSRLSRKTHVRIAKGGG